MNLFNFFREKIEEKGIFDLLSSASTCRGNSTLKQRVSPLKQFFSLIRSLLKFVTFEKMYNNLSSPNFSIRVTIYAQLLPSRFHSCFYDFNDFQPDDSVKKGVSGIPRSRAFFGKNSNLERAREEEGRSDVWRPIFVSSERGESKEGLISRN